ncbi:MAG: E2/UBC family protein [Deltaproteobacteria bacterium]|nr:E2/UBC family protein [Deltaproteobacteria bacterium]
MAAENREGPKYFVDIEGTVHPWEKDTITTEEILALGGWDASQGVIEVDKDNVERTLKPGEVIELKPGHGFSKKVKWKRGVTLSDRIGQELALLRKKYPDLEYVAAGQWARIPSYPLPEGWNRTMTDVVFAIPVGYPATAPYGIYVPAGILHKDARPNNYTEPASNTPPFSGSWGIFSWSPADGEWRPTANLQSGPNLLNYVQGFANRFREGA